MKFSMSGVIRAMCLTAVVLTAFGARANVVVDWNAKAEAIAVKKKMLPPPNARGMAIMHVAMFEAVNAVERRYGPYRLNLTAARNASKEAAAAAAAHFVLMALHPDEQETINAALTAALAAIPDGDAKTSRRGAWQEGRSGNPCPARQGWNDHAGNLSSATPPRASTFQP